MRFALLPGVAADLKRAADGLLISRISSVTLGERISLARRASGGVAAALLLDKESRVWQAALENPRLTEAAVVRAVRHSESTPALLEAISRHPKWSLCHEVTKEKHLRARKQLDPNPQKLRPLAGVRILVGRARHQASALSRELRKLGGEVFEIPFIQIRKPQSFQPLDSALKNLAGYDWLILTSVNGVEAMWGRLMRLRLDKPNLARLRVAAIGPATKKAIEQRGFRVDVVPKEYVAESVVRSLTNRVKGKHVLLVRARIARDVIPRELRRAGARVDLVEAYETVVPESSRKRLRGLFRKPDRRPHVVTFTSSSTARNFIALLGDSDAEAGPAPTFPKRGLASSLPNRRSQMNLDGVRLASIGPVTSATLRELGLPVDIEATEFTIPGLVEAIVRALAEPQTSAPGSHRR
jgi:uroporphyrinogen-III synthase